MPVVNSILLDTKIHRYQCTLLVGLQIVIYNIIKGQKTKLLNILIIRDCSTYILDLISIKKNVNVKYCKDAILLTYYMYIV